ncbi:hypothetical protein KEM56_007555 [Ascosphaera pollenicola]|nr:hypothetical protein KEM56_007555 [Ascosphaera pollenicola]
MSSEAGLFQSLYRKYAPVFSSKAYTPLAQNKSERHNWDVEGRKSIDTSSLLSERSDDLAERPDDAPKLTQYRDAFDDEKELDFEHLSHFTPKPEKAACWENWYLIVTAALLGFHHEEAVSMLWKHISKTRANDEDGHYVTTATERIMGACLKSAALVGLPRVTNALSSLSSVIQIPEENPKSNPSSNADGLPSPNGGEDLGREIFEQMHGAGIHEALNSMSVQGGQESCSSVIKNIYGSILSGPGILSTVETAMIAFASCLADNMPIQAER